MNSKINSLLCLISLSLFGAASTWAQPAPPEEVIIADKFDSRENWKWDGDVLDNQLVLTAAYKAKTAGAQALLSQPIQLPREDGKGLRIRFKINDVTDAEGGIVMSEARFFFVPAPLKRPTFADSFSDPSALSIIVAVDGETQLVTVHLYQKEEQTLGGHGTKLYTGELPVDSFPITFDWWFSSNSYKLKTAPEGQLVFGSEQGEMELGSMWEGEMRYVMRGVNAQEGVRTQLRIADFSISTASMPE